MKIKISDNLISSDVTFCIDKLRKAYDKIKMREEEEDKYKTNYYYWLGSVETFQTLLENSITDTKGEHLLNEINESLEEYYYEED